jgi:tetratricopeptide (TPR) repeat protein
MKRRILTILIIMSITLSICYTGLVEATEKKSSVHPAALQSASYAGSLSCRECHEKFYQLWSTSKHGLAMQPYTPDFAKAQLTPQQKDVVIKKYKYRADIKEGVVIEAGPKGKNKYKIEHVMGGKNVYYFLTPFKKGRLQTLPVAYDVNKKEWFDTAASGMRHFPGGEREQTVNWKEPPYTFNTACYSCHVSQLSTNYNLKKDTYHTVWAEPGINCETCHGPGVEHNKIAKATPKGQPLPEMKIISTKTMTKEERNALCSSCHAKGIPLTLEYRPKERFLDHFDVVLLENPDYYADGRDLGENYTYTSWLMSPCAQSGKIDCMHCHTSSGRYRFNKEKFNDACMPCHVDKVNNPTEHTRHPAESVAGKCISCHMPMTSFARMNRSDHSMLPPAPAATMAYKSPNACNICHKDKDAEWADKYVRQWRIRDYQSPVLKRAALIDAARKRDWSKLPDMLDYIQSKDREVVFAVSLIRLIPPLQDEKLRSVLLAAGKDPSPLVRAAAVEALGPMSSHESLQILVEATGDEYRVVRVRAAAGLSQFPQIRVPGTYGDQLKKANEEYLAFIMARPDQWTSHYNMGNYHLNRGELKQAVESYKAALMREPRAVMAMVNSSIAYSRAGQNDKAEQELEKALKTSPANAAALFNMGLLKAEQKDLRKAETYLKKALDADQQMAQAAYNLCIITAKDRINEAVTWCRKAAELRPQEPKFAYTLAFYLNQKGDRDEAVNMLKAIIEKYPGYKDAEMLVGEILRKEKGD